MLKVTIDLSGDLIQDTEAEMRVAREYDHAPVRCYPPAGAPSPWRQMISPEGPCGYPN